MANAPLKKIIQFYVRFTPSYSAIGYYARSIFWRRTNLQCKGQTWLITGGSEGIGAAAAIQALRGGAQVICVARDRNKLQQFSDASVHPERVIIETADFSKIDDVLQLGRRLKTLGRKIDVVVNNVGIQKKNQTVTSEGKETSFATNVLNHYQLIRDLMNHDLLSSAATVIEVSSGGMYNHMMQVNDLNMVGPGYAGPRAYGLAKRAQVMMMSYWQQKFGATDRRFYAMHPGWVNTASVNRSMPRFVAILRPVLRTHQQGADTITWLAAARPAQKRAEAIWFDRKERTTHIYPHTVKTSATAGDVMNYLEKQLATIPST